MDFQIADKRVTFPNCWQQVTLGQLLQIRSHRSLSTLDAIAILSNQTTAFWRSVNPVDIASQILPCLEWSNEAFDWNSLPAPCWLVIKGEFNRGAGPNLWYSKVLEVPFNLDLESYGQKVYIESLIGNEKLSSLQRVPLVLAAYFEPIYSGQDFNVDRLEDFLPVILATSCTEALPIYSFFFRKFSASMRSMAG